MAERTPKSEKPEAPKSQPPPEVRRQTLHLDGIDLKEAVKAARTFLHEMEKENLIAGPIKDVQLEGVHGGALKGATGSSSLVIGFRTHSRARLPAP